MEDTLIAEDAFEHAACGLVTAHTDGTILGVNSIFCRWLGYAREELIGSKASGLLTIGARLFHQTHWGPLLEMQRSVAELKLELRSRDRTRIPMLLNVRRCRTGNQDIDHFAFMVMADRHKFEQELVKARENALRALEAQRQAEEELRKADRLKDEFLATLAHELRNPLAPMRSVMDLLKFGSADPDRTQWAHGVIDRQLSQLARLVDDLLDVSRFNEGKIELRQEQVDIADVMRIALEGASPKVNAASHQMHLQLPSERLCVHADPTRLAQIMLNLLNNAAKYTPAFGEIWFSAYRQAEEAIIVVRDSGIGIAAGDLPSMFGLFAQLPEGKSYAQGGLGVGLALVKKLTELHGGTVSARSAGLGWGSEFEIRLPLSMAATHEDVSVVRADPISAPARRILVVDDNRDAVESLAMLLQLEGHTVATAFDASSAVLIAKERPVDVALLDIGLPDKSGYELAQELRDACGAALLLVAVTGWGQEDDLLRAKAAGFDLHLTKPVDLQRLREAMTAR